VYPVGLRVKNAAIPASDATDCGQRKARAMKLLFACSLTIGACGEARRPLVRQHAAGQHNVSKLYDDDGAKRMRM
jgi:hypothetical protein